jgi:hypothetical protein
VIDAASRIALQNLLRREGRSLLQYISESFPWITPEEQNALARVQQMVAEEREGIRAIVRFLAKHHVVPGPLAPYPMSFTNINYMSLDHLVPLLIDYQKQRIADIQADLARTPDPACRELIEKFLSMKRRHLQSLEEMQRSLRSKQTVA